MASAVARGPPIDMLSVVLNLSAIALPLVRLKGCALMYVGMEGAERLSVGERLPESKRAAEGHCILDKAGSLVH